MASAIGAGVLSCACAAAQPSPALEEIYVLRSIREQQPPAAGWCAATKTGFEPFPADAERAFSFWSVATAAEDGRVIETKAAKVAALRACLGPTSEPQRQRFYAEINLDSVLLRGQGECSRVMADVPEAHLSPVHCWLALEGLPVGYAGGFLTTNTLTSKAAYGGETDPVGYAQASIATIRLWRSR